MTGGAMLLAIKRNGKWERTDRLDRLCWRLGPTFISLNRRLDYFRDRWFPRAEALALSLGLSREFAEAFGRVAAAAKGKAARRAKR